MLVYWYDSIDILFQIECEVYYFGLRLLSLQPEGREKYITCKKHQKSSDYQAATCLMRLAAMFDCYDIIKCITKNIGGWSLSCYTLVLVFPRYVCGAFELLISRWATLGNIGQSRVMLILELRWPCGRGITSSRCLNFFTTEAGRSSCSCSYIPYVENSVREALQVQMKTNDFFKQFN